MENKELYHHYLKRFRLCKNIINDLRANRNNVRWNSFVSYFRYYDDTLRAIDLKQGRSTAGGGNYKSELKTLKETLLYEYIKINYSDFKIDDEFKKIISETYGFNSYVLSYHVDKLGNTIKEEMNKAANIAKQAFEKLTKSLKK